MHDGKSSVKFGLLVKIQLWGLYAGRFEGEPIMLFSQEL